MQLEEQVAKLAYQFANLIDDKEIDKRWYGLLNRERWFDFAEVAIPIIQKAILTDLVAGTTFEINKDYGEFHTPSDTTLIMGRIAKALKGEADGTD